MFNRQRTDSWITLKCIYKITGTEAISQPGQPFQTAFNSGGTLVPLLRSRNSMDKALTCNDIVFSSFYHLSRVMYNMMRVELVMGGSLNIYIYVYYYLIFLLNEIILFWHTKNKPGLKNKLVTAKRSWWYKGRAESACSEFLKLTVSYTLNIRLFLSTICLTYTHTHVHPRIVQVVLEKGHCSSQHSHFCWGPDSLPYIWVCSRHHLVWLDLNRYAWL